MQRMTTKRSKRILTLVLALVMVLSMFPAAAIATADSVPVEDGGFTDLTGSLYNQAQTMTAEEVDAIRAQAAGADIGLLNEPVVLAAWEFGSAAGAAAANNQAVSANLEGGNWFRPSGGTQAAAAQLTFWAMDEGVYVQRALNAASSGMNVRNAADDGSGGLDARANNAWWQTSISTTGLTDIDVSWHMRSTNTGPRDWQLQYSTVGGTDAADWHNAGEPIVLPSGPDANTWNLPRQTRQLPASAEGHAVVYLRWLLTSATSANNGTIAPGGTHQMNGLVISSGGTGTITLPEVMTIAEVNAAAAGEAVVIEGYAVGVAQLAAGAAQNRTLMVQDGTGANDGIQVDAGGANISAHVGQRIRVTGTRGEFGGVAQLVTTTAQIENLAPHTVAPISVTAAQLTPPAFRSMMVSLENMEVTALTGGTAPANTILLAGAGEQRIELRLVGGAAVPEYVQVGDMLDVTRAFVAWNTARSAVMLINAEIETVAPDVLPVNANPASGSMMPDGGGTVTLTSPAANAEIRWRVNGGAWQGPAAQPVSVPVNTFPGAGGTAVIEAYAVLGALESETRTFTYYEFEEATVVSIADVRGGELGETVTVRGVVTNFYEINSGNNNAFFLQDPDGDCAFSGIMVRLGGLTGNNGITPNDNPLGARAFVGHLVEVTGVYQRPAFVTGTHPHGFAGVDQIAVLNTAQDITILETNVTLPAPTAIGLAQLTGPVGTNRPFSGMLVSVSRVLLHGETTGPAGNNANHVLRDPATGGPLTINGNTVVLNLNAAVPAGFEAGTWVEVHSAAVHLWSGRAGANGEIQLRVLPAATGHITFPVDPPLLGGLAAHPASGGTVAAGGTVTLAAAPVEARIEYYINGAGPAVSTADTVDVTVPADAFDTADTFVIRARAFLPDPANAGQYLETTPWQNLTYTQATVANVMTSHVSGRVSPGTELALTNATPGAAIHFILTERAGETDELVRSVAVYTDPIVLAAGMFPVHVEAWATAPGLTDSARVEVNFTEHVRGGEQIFFGQLHSHTNLSDGRGTAEAAMRMARDMGRLDFFAITDHSNWFNWGSNGQGGTAGTGDLPDVFNLSTYQAHTQPQNPTGPAPGGPLGISDNSPNSRWERGHWAARTETTDEFIGINGFEFTWAGGPGHINTFNTAGWVCRRNAYLNINNNDLRLLRYYELLRNEPQSVSMFNHPGTTFGNFNNFAHFDPEVALRIPLLEVNNGTGQPGGGMFFPSYEQFTLALDRGWLVAPVSSQDNHAQNFGWANEARVAIYTNDLSYEGIWQAFRDRAAFSTEIRDMEIRYYVNNEPMGSIFHNVPENVEFRAEVFIPETQRDDVIGHAPNPSNPQGPPIQVPMNRDDYTIRYIELVTNGGIALHRQYFDLPVGQTAYYNVSLPGIEVEPGYYFLRVISQSDTISGPRGERISLTAPIWLGRAPIVGISEVTTDTFMPVTTEELILETHFFNDTDEAVTLETLEFFTRGAVPGVDTPYAVLTPNQVIAPGTTPTFAFPYTPTAQGNDNITVRAIINVAGSYRVYTGFIDLFIRDINQVQFIGIDGAHFNEYVDGNFRNSFTNFARMAAEENLVTVVFRTEEEIIAAANNERFRLMIFSSPGRHASIIADPERGEHRVFSDATIEAVGDFVDRGGTLAVAGFGNFNEQGSTNRDLAFAQSYQLNQLLVAAGSNIRVGDTSHSAPVGFREIDTSAHQHDLRYAENFNVSNPFMEGVVYFGNDARPQGQLYRNFSTGALYVVNDSDAIPRNAADVTSYVVGGDMDLYDLFGVDVMVLAHPGSWTLDSHTNASRTKFPTPGANFPRYAHPTLGMAAAPPTGTGHGQRPAAGGTNPGQHLVAASQFVNEDGGTVLVFASNFFSNFDVDPNLDYFGQIPANINYNIAKNIFNSISVPATVTPIADVWEMESGAWVTIEGTVTSGLQITGLGSTENRGFMNSIYVQDESGRGINLFEVTSQNAMGAQVGQRVQARGFISAYQGERQLTIHQGGSFQVLDRNINLVEPTPITVAEAASGARMGTLAQVSGVVSNVVIPPGGGDVLQFTLTNGGASIPVYMRAYITPGVDLDFVQDGVWVSAVGFSSHGEIADGVHHRIRVRDRNEIVLIPPMTDFSVLQEALDAAHGHNRTSYTRESWAQLVTAKADAQAVLDNTNATQNEVDAAVRTLTKAMDTLVFLFPDVGAGHWGRTFVEQAFDRGFLNGNPDGTFAPYGNLTRAQVAVIML
ncbi:MAG: S-layer homology domain-containing protein, partial [Oscillospiraceae bacterium]|nr:S-layer homology domain-containing protein [Oscillospiraceae bacterium]